MATYHKILVDGLHIFYREAGDENSPVMLLLHGFPSASHMFRDLIPLLEDKYHIIAPDFVGFGQSDAPAGFDYTFAQLTAVTADLLTELKITSYYMYVFDYGAPIGFRLAMADPHAILGIVSQNGNVYAQGLGPKWAERAKYWAHPTPELRSKYESAFAPETIRGQYLDGTRPGSVSPDGYTLDIAYTHTEGYAKRQSDLIFDYQTNVALYPQFQKYLRQYQPKLLAVWGKNDSSFIPAGALAFKNDLPSAHVELLDTGHFALETHAKEIAALIREEF
ncbi:alpha/beta fold hydrolase [Lacticaseibacillus sharpeae]|uniref:Alpha beta hydrolase fold protein n=1 Tax=Lacticaseibacillus sharpeae JCM 1186 = DSM 20505 TaxID=1291052 RepID=A0A0R1ZJC7_9LACO|nr:alpha/beta hydrolase [Lacticaseibacillus sharpeae]KRM54490.1 alpha beta hydrolase fold protein [Lacticaseibacillus sharpeae JCM 1186 = DSM 20505]